MSELTFAELSRRYEEMWRDEVERRGGCRVKVRHPVSPRLGLGTRTATGYWRVHVRRGGDPTPGRVRHVYVYLHVLVWCMEDMRRRGGVAGAMAALAGSPPCDVSHLCGEPACIHPAHLRRESRTVNLERKLCRRVGTCRDHRRHQAPDCLF